MKKTLALLSATTALALATQAFAAEEAITSKNKTEYKKDGGMTSTHSSSHTTPEGTKVSSDAKVDVDVHNNGDVEKTVKTENITDPKGLMNKKKDSAKTTTEQKADGGVEQKTTRKSTDAAGTNTTSKTTSDMKVDAEGNVVETVKTEKTVDPKGLLNKKKATYKAKTVNGAVVEEKKEGY